MSDTSYYVIGIDLGGTKIRAGLADSTGIILAERTEPTNSAGGPELVHQLVVVIRTLCVDASVAFADLRATGIGGAGVPNDSAGFDLAPNLGASGSGLTQSLEAALGHRVVLENDVNVAAIGELVAGVGRETDNFVFVAVGTGLGMGIVVNGQLVRGATGAAGEIGFLPFGADPFDPANHLHGPLEEVTAGHTLADRYRRSTGQTVSTRDVFALAGRADSDAIAALDDEAQYLALALVAVNAILNPEIFVLGGGVGSRTGLLPHLTPWLVRLGAPTLDIRFSELGHQAPIVGAVQLALEALATNPLVKGSAR
ncbi:ROK family protein [Cryobacterium sp. N19]|uniref:ROK family protein n=1 Tax=Cryobacterium sp. N19 TaxID=2048288 RepID=UPI0013049DF3|nr:ROK family protein [Cryobacterium sp. N19]